MAQIDSNTYYAGDNLFVRRNVTTTLTVQKAWLTLKTSVTLADDDATVQKEITTIDVPGTGRIEDAGAGGTAELRFDLTPVDTKSCGRTKQYYDIQVMLSDGQIATVESNSFKFLNEVTKATS